ncbi:hypothetical protein VULLAG_LOCUS89 [Vulpes lagopus]
MAATRINHPVHTYPGLRFSNLAKSVAYGVVKDSIREAYVHCASFMNKTRGFDSYTEDVRFILRLVS